MGWTITGTFSDRHYMVGNKIPNIFTLYLLVGLILPLQTKSQPRTVSFLEGGQLQLVHSCLQKKGPFWTTFFNTDKKVFFFLNLAWRPFLLWAQVSYICRLLWPPQSQAGSWRISKRNLILGKGQTQPKALPVFKEFFFLHSWKCLMDTVSGNRKEIPVLGELLFYHILEKSWGGEAICSLLSFPQLPLIFCEGPRTWTDSLQFLFHQPESFLRVWGSFISVSPARSTVFGM